MIDRAAYNKLVKEVSAYWEPISKPEMKWYEGCHQINLWTYWQGIDAEDVDILVVGQDWGKPNWDDNITYKRNIKVDENIRRMNEGDLSVHYLDGVKPCATDRNIAKLLTELRAEDEQPLFPKVLEERYKNLFFTNFCLGYRRDKETGNLSKENMLKDSLYFKKLVEIVKPKIIICLGKMVFESVLYSLYKETIVMTAREYWNLLNNKGTKCYRRSSAINDLEIIIYGMGHCGAFGVNINRKNFDKDQFPDDVGKKGMKLMQEDWNSINSDIKKLGIKPVSGI